jgi:hypothetical protein
MPLRHGSASLQRCRIIAERTGVACPLGVLVVYRYGCRFDQHEHEKRGEGRRFAWERFRQRSQYLA